MTEEFQVLSDVHQKLSQMEIHYMVTGSIALNYYAKPRMTRDIDIVIALFDHSIPSLVKTFQDNFYIDESMIFQAQSCEGMFNVVHNETLMKIDFIVKKQSEYRSVEFERRKKVKFKHSEFWIVSLEDLILSKLEWAKKSQSKVQLSDIKSLLKNPVDHDYLSAWIRKLGLFSIYQEVH